LPEQRQRHGDNMAENILEASELKMVNDVFLYSHYPCGVAGKSMLSVIDQALGLIDAKIRLKEQAAHLRIKCFFHVDMYDEAEGASHKRRTYFIPKEKWTGETLQSILREF